MDRLVLGIDPGSLITGYGLLAGDGFRTPRYVEAGTIKTQSQAPLEIRLVTVYEALTRILTDHQPNDVAIEDVFHAKNARSALALGHARGVALLAAARAGRPVFAYAPARIKQAVTGSGRAGKSQVAQVLAMLLGLAAPPAPDAADALAVALCHLNTAGAAGGGRR